MNGVRETTFLVSGGQLDPPHCFDRAIAEMTLDEVNDGDVQALAPFLSQAVGRLAGDESQPTSGCDPTQRWGDQGDRADENGAVRL
jgi:hypothetical protein